MDPLTFWTALGVLVVLFGGIAGVIRKGDRDAMDIQVTDLDNRLKGIGNQMAEKAQREEVARIEARFEKDIADLRLDQKTGFAEIRQDIKDLRTDFMNAIERLIK